MKHTRNSGTKHNASRWYALIALVGMLAMLLWPTAAAAIPLTDEQELKQAWEYAADVGVYRYRTDVLQTIHPTPRLSNVGRSSKSERFSVAGMMDRPNDTMEMRIAADGTIELKVVDGVSYGRLNAHDEWTQVESQSNFFAPGGDPLGYLNAAENIQEAGGRMQDAESGAPDLDTALANPHSVLDGEYSVYTFDLSGPKYARFMRDQMEEYLSRAGKLPSGVDLGLANTYVDMQGHGEIWVDAETNLPIRQIIRLEFPAEPGTLNWVSADITTDFSGWEQGLTTSNQGAVALTRLRENPTVLFTNPQSLFPNSSFLAPANVQQFAFTVSLSVLVLGLVSLLITYHRSPKLYTAITLTMIVAMVFTPLMRSNQVYAFYEQQESKQTEREQQTVQRETQEQLQADISGRNFNPHQKPSRDRSTDVVVTTADLKATMNLEENESCSSDNDADGDGLSDNVECYETGTWVDNDDTDGDFILDSVEVAGFEYGGKHWYLNPRSPDSNGDGLLDEMECPELVSETGTPLADDAQCRDADQDGTPDVFDFDNDGDGVPDTRDSSPDSKLGDLNAGLSDGQLNYDIVLTDTEQLIFVDFELRPTNSEHLWYAGNVLDWPSGDTQGQIRRQGGSTTAETFMDFDLETYENSPTADHGDLQVNPFLEIQIPYDGSNPSGGLPVTSTSSIDDITSYDNIDWLDTQTLAEYGISVTFDEDAGDTLWVYVPLITLDDSTGDSPVALTGRMVYRPEILNWGQKHQARLIWMINALTDTCDTSSDTMPEEFTYDGKKIKNTDDDAYESWCAMDSYDGKDIWKTSQSVIHSYYDDFYITGMSVREDHGIDLAIIAETDTSLAYESDLWHLANTLQNTWMDGRLHSNGERLDVFGIDDLYDDWGITNALYTEEIELESQTNLGDVAQIHNTHVLTGAIPSPADGYSTTLLYAGEETYRSVGLPDDSVESLTNDLSLDFSNQTLNTMAFMRWSPFSYDAATDSWDGVDYAAYVPSMEPGLASVFGNDVIDSLVNYESVSDYDALRTGAVQLALSYYMSLYQGPNSLVAIDGESINTASLQSIIYTQDPAVTVAQTMLGDIQAFYDQLDLSVTAVNGDTLLSTWNVLANSPATLLQAIADADQGTVTNYNLAFAELFDYYKTFTFDTSDYLLTTPLANALVGSVVTSAITTLQMVGFGLNNAQNLTIVGLFAKEAYTFYNLYYYYNKVKDLSTPLGNFTNLTRMRSIQSILSLVVNLVLTVAPLVYALVSGSIQITDLDFTAALARTIARVYVLIVSFILSANPVGALVLTIIGIIDGLIRLVCAIVESANGDKTIDKTVDTWVCGGIMSAVSKAITYLIFDQTPMVDLEKDGRLVIELNEPTLIDPASGIVLNNALKVSAAVRTNLYFNEPTLMGYTYWHQFDDDNLNDSTFEYRLQSEEKDREPKQNQVDWEVPPGREPDTDLDIPNDLRYYKVFYPSETFTLATYGVNQVQDIYFTESFNMNSQECWTVYTPYPVPVCYVRTYKNSLHTDLRNDFIFDVLPDTLTGFMELASSDGGTTYRLAWDDSFPLQWDADGDGLISQAKGGDDPDDGNPDIDFDGLSDRFEYELGSKLDSADTDCDGLTDYWEVFYGTDPNRADSDRDGLTDGLEVFHSNVIYPYENSNRVEVINTCENKAEKEWSGGWEVVYDFDDDGNPLTSWVSADPADFDSDDDGIIDNFEFIYGYNPNAISSLNVLSLNSGLPGGDTYLPGANVVYTATIQNELDNRYAQGLLQAEYPVDNLVSTDVMETLVPLASTTMIGSIDLESDVSATTVTTLTIRAGAAINDLSTERLVWLHLNEKEDSTIFADDSFTGHDFACSGDSCPTANGSYLTFAGGTAAGDEGDMISLSSSDLQDDIENFTVGGWYRPTGFESEDFILFSNSISFKLVPAGPSFIPVVSYNTGSQDININWSDVDIPGDQWTHLMLTWKMLSGKGTLTLYVNGDKQGTPETDLDPISYADSPTAYLSPVGDVDEFEFYPSALEAAEVRNLVTVPSLHLDFASMSDISNQANQVVGDAPDVSGNQADFDGTDVLWASGQGLDLSAGKFTFSTWIKPQARYWNDAGEHGDAIMVGSAEDAYPAIAYSAIENTRDTWQHIAGYEIYQDDDDNDTYETIYAPYPTLAHDNTGKVRMRFGEKYTDNPMSGDLCSFESDEGVLEFDTWQYLTVSYNGSQFFVYIDGVEKDNGGGSDDCADARPSASSLFVGNGGLWGYLWVSRWYIINSSDHNDYGNAEEARFSVDNEAFWSNNNVENDDSNVPETRYINKGAVLNSRSSTFRHWEDDGSENDNIYNSSKDDTHFKETVYAFSRKNTSNHYYHSGYGGSGDVYWGQISYFFKGALQDFRVYNYNMESDEVADLFNTNSYALKLDFDEPPGEDIFADSSGNDYPGECDSNVTSSLDDAICPDSGIPGRNNQSLRFDGQNDTLTFEATPENLGLDGDGDFSVMAWVKLDSLEGDQTILASNEWSFDELILSVRDGYPYMGYFADSDLDRIELSSNTALAANEWVHLAWVYQLLGENADTNTVTSTHTIYVNGAQKATLTVMRPDAELTTALVVGYHRQSQTYLDAMLDDLTIARTALDADDILAASLEAPVLNLHLDEDYAPVLSGEPFVDETNNYNDAVCGSNCPLGGDKGQMREAAVFTATNSIIATDDDNLDLGEFSASLWVKPSHETSHDQQLFSKQDGSDDDVNFNLSIPADSLQVEFDLQGSSCSSALGPLKTGGELIEDQWNHIVATFDNENLVLYINGSYDISSTIDITTTACTAGTQFILGDGPFGNGGQGFEGSIDEVAVYGTALHAETVSDIFDYQASWFDVVYPHTLVIDAEPPEISNTDGYVSTAQDGGEVILSVHVIDADSSVALVEYSVNQGDWTPADQGIDDSAAWMIVFEPESDGWHTIRYRATDAPGNQSESEEWSVYVDVTIPTISRNYMGNSIKAVSDSIALSGEVIDRGRGVATGTVTIELLDALGVSVNGDLPATATSDHYRGAEADWTIDYPFPVPPYGTYTILASAEDRHQNRQDSYELTSVRLDGYGPVADVGSYSQVLTDTYFFEDWMYGLIGTASDLLDPLDNKVLSLHLERWARYHGQNEIIIDSSGNGLNAICDTCPPLVTIDMDHPYGKAVSFTGGDNLITVPANESLNLDDFTLGMWVKPLSTQSGWQTLIRKDSDGTISNRNFALQMHSDSTQLRFEIQASTCITGVAKTLDSTTTLPIDSFTHVMATFDSASEEMALYLNGELDASATFTGTPGICTSDNDVLIGENSNAVLDEIAIYNRALAPLEVYHLANPLTNSIEQVNLRFRHAGGNVWTDLDPDGIKLYLSMDNDPVMDVSPFAQEVSCVGNCPEQEMGREAFAIRFDGVDDGITVTNLLDPAATDFGASVWFNLDDLSANQPLLHQQNGQTWLGVDTAGKLYTNLGGSTLESSETIAAGVWHHAALTSDGNTLALYLNGSLAVSATVSIAASDGDLLLGFDSDVPIGNVPIGAYLSGALDEVFIHDRALSGAEIETMATTSPWLETDLNYGYSDGYLGRIFADWYYKEPIPRVEGIYAIDLWAVDGVNNASYIPNAWIGSIDMIGPRITLTITEISDYVSQITCEATDFNLDDTTFGCPATGDATFSYQDADWFTQVASDTNKLYRLSNDTQNKMVVGDYSFTACDLFDNCTTFTEFVINLFEDANAGIPATYNGDAHWGDYDADGDLDILVTGCLTESDCDAPLAYVYAQDAGTFGLYATLTGQRDGGSAWGDYDADGDLDIVISGNRGAVDETTLYENTGGGFSASATIGDDYGFVAWGDFDNDNDLDLLIEGALYQNDGGSFSLHASLVSQIEDYANWGDYDNDGDLDLVIDGEIYDNDDASLSLNYTHSLPTYSSDADWGDYDNDGDLDLLMGGYNMTQVQENNAGTFSRVYGWLDTGFYHATVAWGDYDSDGLLDILVSGKTTNSGLPQLEVYRNIGAGFELVQSQDGVLGSAEWGDYDNDGYPDVLLNGCTDNDCDSTGSIVYQSRVDVGNEQATNTAPTAPDGLNASTSGTQVTLTWGTATDAETPDEALRYNLYAGSAAEPSEGKSPMALLSGADEGWQLRPGQSGLLSTTLNLTLTQPGDYVWSVQAVDGAFAGSPWAAEGEFHIAGADLEISKQVDSIVAQSGDTIEYTLVFTNNVGDTVTDATITDTVPVSLTNVIYQSGGIGVTPVGGANYTWDVDPIAVGESGVITVTGQVDGSFESGQYIANVAQIGSAAYDNDLENNEAGALLYPGSGTVCTNYESAVLADNPVGYWRLSDPTSVADNLGSIGSAVDGSYVGATLGAGLIWQDPTLAARFDGTDDYILIPNHSDLTGETSVKTIELWFQADADLGSAATVGSPQTTMLYEQGGNRNDGLNLFINSIRYSSGSLQHKLIATVADNLGGESYLLTTFSADAIHHVVLVYQGTTITAYLDGVQVKSRSVTGSQLNDHNGGDIRIGANGGGYIIWNWNDELLPFSGVIDEVAVYNSALGADRVAAHYAACLSVDLAVSKSVDDSYVYVGDTITYHLTFDNVGYETASGVTISDPVPSDLSNITYTWDADGGVNLVQTPGTTYEWTVGDLPSGSGGVITISGVVSDSAIINTNIVNRVSAETSSEEFNTANNAASAGVYVMKEIVPPPDPTFVLDSIASGDLQNIYLSSVDWGDYDDDGDLDMLMNGHSGVYRLARVYRNDDGRFTNISAGLPAIQDGSVDWGDYDNDGYLDILITGSAGSTKVTRVYHNDGSDTFSDIGAGLTGVHKGNAEWGDYDDDGDLDILVTGHTGTNPDSRIYRNDGGTFTDIGASLSFVYLSSSTWADYDNDGDLDILISGALNDGSAVTSLYRNEGSDTFTYVSNTGLPALYDTTSSAIAWGDYDNDTYPDLLLSGNSDSYGPSSGVRDITAVYRNNGDDTFSDIGAGLPGIDRASVAWDDYDGDGYLDILLAGNGLDQASVYANDGSGSFDVLAYETLPPLISGDVAWGDYDDDGALDILLTGQSGANTLTEIWRNTSPVLRLDSSSYSVDENVGSVTIDVSLNEFSAEGDVSVDYVSTDGSALAGSDYAAVSGTLTILSDTLGSSFDVSITDDALPEGNETLALSLLNPSGAGLGTPYSATLTIIDNDTVPGVTVTPTSVSVTEGGVTDSYQVVLGSQPADDVVITIGTDGQTTVSPTVLTFVSGDWDDAQGVTVTAVDDDLIEGAHGGTITHTAASADTEYDDIGIGDVSAAISDNDAAGVDVTPTSVSVTEGGATDSYDVVLTSEPSATVTITVATDAQVTADPTSLTFSTLDWDVAQSVNVTAVDDGVIEGLHSGTISHTAASADADYDGISIDDVSAAITDNDGAGVDIAPTSVNVTEGGATDNYDVVLTAQPTDTVTISIFTDSQTTVSQAALIFGTGDWDTAQTVTVTAVNDGLIEGEHSGTISHTSASADADYVGIGISDVIATITDDDSAGVDVSPTNVNVAEGGATGSYQVVLTSQPTATVTISVITDSQTSVDSASLVFTTITWSDVQTVTVTAVDDDLIEGAHSGTINHTVSSGDGDYDGIPVDSVNATISDNDSAGVSVVPGTVNVSEDGTTDDYQVVLTTQPTATVTIDVITDSQTSVNTTTLTFGTSDWDTPQTVTVSAVDDDIAEGSHNGSISHNASSSDGEYDGIGVSGVSASIDDDDTAGVSVLPTDVSVGEDGTTDSYQVALTSQPTATVTINVITDSQTSVTSNTLTFTASNWDAAQTVTVSAVDDDIVEGEHDGNISHTASSSDGSYDGFGVSSVSVTIFDDDTAGITVIPTSVSVAEGGASDTYDVVLTSEPTATVTISISTDSETSVDPVALTFISGDWDIAQTVTVSAVVDAVVEGPHSSTISHVATSSDGAYNGFIISDVTARVGDSPHVVITPTSVSVVEGGATDTYDVVLTSQPGDTVTVTAAAGAQVNAVPDELVFGTGSWAFTQTVTVSAVDDDVDEGVGTHSDTINHTSASNDSSYVISIDSVSATIGDNDSAGINVFPTSVSLAESDITTTQVYSIVLITEPTDPVTLTIGTDDGETSVDPNVVSFTVASWAVTQTITVTVVDDEVVEGPHNGTITHTAVSSDGNYDDFSVSNVVASIDDDDGVFDDVPEAITYTLVYALDILTNTNYNSGSPAYFIDNSASIGTFDRVAYHMVLSDTWAYASMPAFTSTVAHIGVPVQNLGVTIAYTTSDLNFLYSSGGSGTGVYGGLEFWPNAYSPERRDEVQDENGTLVPVEDDDTFDWNDTPLTTGAYTGSLQVGYYRVQTGDETCCTVMAWNNWDTPAVDDVGFRAYGLASDSDPADFTGLANAADYPTRTLYVLVHEVGGGMLHSSAPSIEQNSALPLGQADEDAARMPGSQTGFTEFGWPENMTAPLVVETDSAELARSQAVSDMLETIQSRPVAAGITRQSGSMNYTIVGNPQSRVVYRVADVSVGVSSVLTPTFPAALTNTATISIGGFIASLQDVSALDVTVDGTSIYTLTYGAGVTETAWSATWTPPGEGIYELEAALTNGNATVITDSTETLLYVDLNAPDISLDTQYINAQNFAPGQIVIAGTVTDTIGIVQVQAKVNGDEWRTANLATTPEGSTVHGTYTATLGLGTTDVPTDTSYVVDVLVTDRGGWQTSLQSTLTADAVAPSLTGLVLSADGQDVSQNSTINWAQTPDLTLTWDATSDPNGISGYRVEWMEHLSDTVNVLQSNDLSNSATGDTYTTAEAQKLSVRLTATDGLDNARSQTFGPFYVDYGDTPIYVDATDLGRYEGWLADSCNLLGLDNRLAQSGSSSLDEQQFHSSWNADGLRLAWAGANWGADGDLFIYLDTGGTSSANGGSTVAYNPYPASEVSVAIFLPTDLGNDTQMAADYLVWVQDETTASLLTWDGSQWVEVVGDWGYAFDANRATPQTDLYLPFDTLGISNPVTQSLGLVAFASEDDALKLWATSPADNNLSSARVIGAPSSNDVEAFTLLKAYHWDSLDSGICPADGQFNGADLAATIRANSAGVGYGLFSHQLVAAHRQLFSTAAPWADAIDALCGGEVYPNRAASGEPIPLPALCQRDAISSTPRFLNPRQSLGHLFSTAHPPVVDGDTMTVTLRVTNHGLSAAQNVTATLVAEHLLTLAGGQPEQTISLGSLAAGESVNREITVTVDVSANPGQSDGWTHLQAIIYDETGDRDHPREMLHLNHEVDQDAPDYVEIQAPLNLTAGGEQTIWGFVSDQSVVPTITLEIDGGEQSCRTGGGARWSCDVDLGTLSDGDNVTLRVQAVDVHGQTSAWFDGPTLTVDTTAPVISNTNITTKTFDGGLVGPDDNLLTGRLLDNRLVGRVEVCEDGACRPARMQVEPGSIAQRSYTYDDHPAAPVLVGPNNDCSTPLVRTFTVSDSFTIADLDVGLNIEHAFRNDLDVWLESPMGTRVQLAAQGAAAANLDVTLDDAALVGLHLYDDRIAHDSSAPYYGRQRQPYTGQLYAFRGESAAGMWLLEICDQYPDEDEGLYNRSQLSFRAVTTPTNSAAAWQYNLDLPQNVEQADKTITLYGYDSLGNRSAPITLTFEIDTRAPVVSVSNILALSKLDVSMTADGSVSDANGAVMRLTIMTPHGQLTADRVERIGSTWVYSDTHKFRWAGDYQVWMEAKDALGNVAVAGPYQVERLPAGYLIYLPIVARNWDHSLTVFPNRVHLPVIIK